MVSYRCLQWLLCFSGFLDLLGVSMIFPLLIHRAQDLGASPSQIGLFGSIYGSLQFFASPLMGQVSDHVGRRNVAVVAMVGTAMSYFLLGQATTIIMLCVARIPSGLFKFSQSMSRTLLADMAPPSETAAVIGSFNSMSSFGFIVGPALAGILMSLDNGFRIVATLSAAIFLLNAVLVYCFVPSTSSTQAKKQEDVKTTSSVSNFSPLSIFKDVSLIPWRLVWQPFLIKFLLALAILVFRSNWTSILLHRFAVDARTNGFIMSFNGVMSTFGSAMVRWVSPWFRSNDTLHNTFSVVLVLSLLLITLAPTLTVVLVGIVPFCFSSSVLRVTNSVSTYSKGGSEVRGLMVGLSDTFTALSRSLAPVIAGFAQEASLYGPGLFGTFFAFLATCVGFIGVSEEIKMHAE